MVNIYKAYILYRDCVYISTMTELIVFKVFVRPTPKCIAVLRYFDKNIEMVNRLGAGVRIENIGAEEIDESTIDLFRKKGITRLPAALSPDGKVFIGLQQITNIFNKNISRGRTAGRIAPATGMGDDYGGMMDLTDFYTREMFSGPDKHGRRAPLQDKDEREDAGADIERRMAEYRRRPPAHRVADAQRERDIDRPTRGRRVVRQHDDYDTQEDEDNIADYPRDDSPPPRTAARRGRAPPTVAPSGNTVEDELDNRILAAVMDKSPNGTDF